MTPPSEPAAPARVIHPTRRLARFLRRAAWCLGLGLLLTAALLAFCGVAARHSPVITQTTFTSASDNLCVVQRAWCRWAGSVNLRLQQLTNPDAPVGLRGEDPGPLDVTSSAYTADPAAAIEPRPLLGDGFSDPPTAGELAPVGLWVETVYGWPLRCLRVRGVDLRKPATTPGPSKTIGPVAGRWAVALAPLQTAVTVGTLSALVFVVLTVAAGARRRARVRRNQCVACGYPLPPSGLCPECGAAAPRLASTA